MENKDLYNELATECGEVVNENTVKTVEGDNITEELKKASKIANHYAYGDAGPVPGETINTYLDDIANVKKEDAITSMIAQSAFLKAQEETENKKQSLSKEEKAKMKKQFVEYMMYQQEEAYFAQNHYIMDGKTKRRVRKMIEKNYDKGKYGSFNGTNLNA